MGFHRGGTPSWINNTYMKYKLPSGAGNKQIFNFGLIFFFIPIINYDLRTSSMEPHAYIQEPRRLTTWHINFQHLLRKWCHHCYSVNFSIVGNKQIFNFGLIFFFIPIINYDLLLLVATMVFGGPSLILDKEFSPPEDIPDYKDRIYSDAFFFFLTVNQHLLV
jgi:hypothetical protein